MRARFISSICFTSLLFLVVSINCSSTQKRTEERAKERVIQFICSMSEDRIEDAEKLLSRELAQSDNMEPFLNNYDDWQLKDTSIVINVDNITFDSVDKNKAVVSIYIRNERLDFTKIGTLPIKFERGDWYIGG